MLKVLWDCFALEVKACPYVLTVANMLQMLWSYYRLVVEINFYLYNKFTTGSQLIVTALSCSTVVSTFHLKLKLYHNKDTRDTTFMRSSQHVYNYVETTLSAVSTLDLLQVPLYKLTESGICFLCTAKNRQASLQNKILFSQQLF